jgi:hypothetical protein
MNAPRRINSELLQRAIIGAMLLVLLLMVGVQLARADEFAAAAGVTQPRHADTAKTGSDPLGAGVGRHQTTYRCDRERV